MTITVSAATEACSGTGYQTKATANGDPFASVAVCNSYDIENPGFLVSCTRVGTSGDDDMPDVQSGEVVCGFGGNDTTLNVLIGGTFYGGPGHDQVGDFSDGAVSGTFNGGAGIDSTPTVSVTGVFNGGDANDGVTDDLFGTFNGEGGDDDVRFLSGTFNGGAGVDHATFGFGTFNGGDDNDWVNDLYGTFNGQDGDDIVVTINSGTFNGGNGDDRVEAIFAGTYDGGPNNDVLCDDQFAQPGTIITNVETVGCST